MVPNGTSVSVFFQSHITHSEIGDIHRGHNFDPAERYGPMLRQNHSASWVVQCARDLNDRRDTSCATIQKELGGLCDAVQGRMEQFEHRQYSFTEVSVQ